VADASSGTGIIGGMVIRLILTSLESRSAL